MIDQARGRIEGWKSSLLGASISLEGGSSVTENPLLDLRDGADSLPLPGVEPLAFAAMLGAGGAFAFEAGHDPAADRGWLRIPITTRELERRLGRMRRAARAELAESGTHTLWVALGLLTWCEADGRAHVAPLVLWPAELERAAGGGLRLVACEAIEPRVNDVLVEKLRRDFDIVVPVTDGPIDLGALFAAVEGLALTRPGWSLERGARLGLLSLRAHALWADLEARGESLLERPVIAHLAAGGGLFAQPSIAAAEAVTRPRAHAEVLAPLDADSSQLAAIAAAGAGASFVLHGAPGTGKSQTIANLIAHCVSHGKTVLFVSGKRAALETVQQRLAGVGLSEFCLELYAHKASRGPVLAQLARVLERAFRPGAGPSGDDARLSDLRTQLDAHVAALHKVGPFGRSLHDVLGRLVELRTTPRAALAERDAVGLDRVTFERRRVAIEQLAAAAVPVEPVATHPWRLSTLEPGAFGTAFDGRQRAQVALDEMTAALVALAGSVKEVAVLVPGLVARTRDQLQALGALGALAAASPRPGAELLTNIRGGRGEDVGERVALIRARGTGTVETPRDPLAFLALAAKHRVLADEVEDRFTEAVADLDAPELWAQLRKWTNSMAPLRYVALRNARTLVKAAAMPGALDSDGAMITALEAVIAERACRAALSAASEPAKRWFGELGGDPLALDLPRLEAAVGWAGELRKAFDAVEVSGGEAGRASAWRSLVAQVAAGPAGTGGAAEVTAFARLAEAVARWIPALASLSAAVGIDPVTLAAGDDHVAALRDRVDALRHALDSLRDWVAFHAARHTAITVGLGPAITAIERGDLGAAELAPAWERATLLAWADTELAETPALARFHGAAHHAQVSAFADLDRGVLALARARALVRLAERVPKPVFDPSAKDGGGELGQLMAELKKPREPMSLRRLFAALPTVLPKLAPCMLASPQAVAQLLDPALPLFDVVVIDEASQLTVPESIGALARGAAAVIVGDPTQAPAGTAEPSLLAEALAAKLPALELAWHYRSKHEDLIAHASQRWFGDRLHVFPAAQGSSELGVALRRIDGAVDPDVPGVNRLEAEAVVADALARLRDPVQRARSLAIIAGTAAQQELIEDLLDEARAADPSLDVSIEPAVDTGATVEPLLVKHVDAIQGDERDVVLFSIASLAPFAERGGERRVAIAATRAREQLIVFSAVGPEDIVADAPGLHELVALLAFAKAGGGATRLLEEAPPASPITAAIARALAERGWIVRHQVGCGPFKLDLAIVDANDPDRYVLAIETDGAAYASAPAARDRDRLRPQVLAQLGWRLHKLWSLDWWMDPEREIQRAHGAIVTAIAAGRQRRVSIPPATKLRFGRSSVQVAAGSSPVARPSARALHDTAPILAAGSGPTEASPIGVYDGATTPTRIPRGAIAIGPYTAAAIPAGRRTPDDMFAPRHLAELGKVVEQVLAAEAPMHIDLLARRVGGYFGIGRVTQRVSDQVRVALAGRGRIGDEENVVWRLDQDPAMVPAVRVAGHGPAARREIDLVPLSELASAARIVVERALGISTNELIRDSARLLGFARITDQVVSRVTHGVELAVARELIRISDGKALLPS